jgi:hypothetical protein
MYVASELLKMLRCLHRDPRQSPQVRAEITAVAQWLNFLLEQHEQIAVEPTEQALDLVKLGGRLLCDACRQRAKDNRYPTGAQEDSASPSPIWKTQLEFLLACTKRVGRELFAQDCASYSLGKFPRCLAKLMNALLRQRRYLASTEGRKTNIVVEHCSNGCAQCGQPIEPPLETAP